MGTNENDKRLDEILDTLRRYNEGNFEGGDIRLSGDGDKLDEIAEQLNKFRYRATSFIFSDDAEKRINNLLEVILKYTLLDFSEKAAVGMRGDELDAIAVGLNTLAEELEAKIKEETKNREQLERFAIILEATGDAVTAVDSNGIITQWNKGAERVYGYTAGEVVGKMLFTELTVREDIPRLREALSRVQSGEDIIDFRISRIRKDGNVIDVSITLSPIYGKDHEVVSISAISRDITTQTRQEELLRKSEETFRLLVKSVKDYAIFKLDKNGYVASWNSGAEAITGYKEEEIIGKHFKIFYTEEDILKKEPEKELRVSAEKGDYHTSGLRKKKDGTLFWSEAVCTPSYNEKGELVGFSKVFRDTTEKRRMDEMIRESKEHIEAILSNAPSAVIVIDEDGIVLNWNAKAEQIFGWKAEAVMNKPMNDFIMPPQFRAEHDEGIKTFLKTGKSKLLNNVVELTALRKNREEFPIELAISALKSKGKYIFISFISDITERKRTDEALRSANEDLDRANKELESFSYSVSHDLRAPLRAIHGYATILLQQIKERLDGDETGMMNSILRNTQKMGQLIDDLLAFSRLGKKELQRKPVNLNEVVKDVLKSFTENPSYKKTKVTTHELPTAYADPHLIAQVYYNLLSNAFKYSADVAQPAIEIGAQDEKGVPVYYVKDNGAGFNMEYYDKLFGVFQRLHDSDQFEGTGVGLAIVKRIIDRHHGRIWAQSAPGKGATFYFSLEKAPVN